jgi:hypothetical protein
MLDRSISNSSANFPKNVQCICSHEHDTILIMPTHQQIKVVYLNNIIHQPTLNVKINGISHSCEVLTISNKGLDPSFSSINSSYCIMQLSMNTLQIHVANHALKDCFWTILTST